MKLSSVILPLISEAVREHKLEIVRDTLSYCDFKDKEGNDITIILQSYNSYAVKVNTKLHTKLKRDDLNPIIITELNL
jgi:hypothetical protein